MVGESGLESPTRSTQSYASTKAGGVVKADSGRCGATAYPGASNEGADFDRFEDLLEAVRRLDDGQRAQVREVLDDLDCGGGR